jgi:S-formylglutathione hydrolase FrmB
MRAAAVVLVLLAGQEEKPKDPPWVVLPKKPIEYLEHKTFKSAAMGVDVGYHLYLPPGYAEEKDRRYPVIYWHHGMNCHESNDQFPAGILDQGIREGKVPPLIMVYPNGGGRTFYCDSVDGTARSETMIVTELIPHIDATYRTIASRDGRALQGMSMGGFGVLKLAFKHPELYSSVVAFAGGLIDEEQLEQRHPDLLKRMFGGDKARFAAETPMALARAKAATIKLPIKLLVGTKDFLLEHNRRMHAVLEDQKIPHEYEEIPDIAHNLPALARHQGTRTLEFAAKAFGAGK